METPAIVTQNLSRHFGSVRAVDGLTLEVPHGTVFGFLGPNGAGKTTTIRLLLGLLAPTSGLSKVLGYDTATQADEIRARTGALLEHHGLYERLSAEENLEFYGRIYRMPPMPRKARIRELLEHIWLWERRKDQVGNWSRGMKQKLPVARTLLARPALVFLDEPTSGLDPVASIALREDLASLAGKEGTTIFLNTHNLAEAEKLCQQVGVIRAGKLLAIGSIEELRASNGKPKAVITGSGFSEAALAILVLSLLFSLLSSAIGVLISLRSSTVRQAQQVTGLISLVPILPLVLLDVLPGEIVDNWMSSLSQLNSGIVVLAAIGILAAIDLALIALSMKQFQRANLILD